MEYCNEENEICKGTLGMAFVVGILMTCEEVDECRAIVSDRWRLVPKIEDRGIGRLIEIR